MNHILPKEYTETLKVLQDKCLVRSANEIEQIFLEEFGKQPSDLFQSLEEEPIAAASLAQVITASFGILVECQIKAASAIKNHILAGFPWCHTRREEGGS